MSEKIPDSVMRTICLAAAMRGADQSHWLHGYMDDDFEPLRWENGNPMTENEAAARAAADVASEWGRQQEREQFKKHLRDAAAIAGYFAEHGDDTDGYDQAQEEAYRGFLEWLNGKDAS